MRPAVDGFREPRLCRREHRGFEPLDALALLLREGGEGGTRKLRSKLGLRQPEVRGGRPQHSVLRVASLRDPGSGVGRGPPWRCAPSAWPPARRSMRPGLQRLLDACGDPGLDLCLSSATETPRRSAIRASRSSQRASLWLLSPAGPAKALPPPATRAAAPASAPERFDRVSCSPSSPCRGIFPRNPGTPV